MLTVLLEVPEGCFIIAFLLIKLAVRTRLSLDTGLVEDANPVIPVRFWFISYMWTPFTTFIWSLRSLMFPTIVFYVLPSESIV
jgi:hypothetical protein